MINLKIPEKPIDAYKAIIDELVNYTKKYKWISSEL